MNKKFISLIAAVILTLFVTACGGDEGGATGTNKENETVNQRTNLTETSQMTFVDNNYENPVNVVFTYDSAVVQEFTGTPDNVRERAFISEKYENVQIQLDLYYLPAGETTPRDYLTQAINNMKNWGSRTVTDHSEVTTVNAPGGDISFIEFSYTSGSDYVNTEMAIAFNISDEYIVTGLMDHYSRKFVTENGVEMLTAMLQGISVE